MYHRVMKYLFVAMLIGLGSGAPAQTAVDVVQALQAEADAPAAGVVLIRGGRADVAVSGTVARRSDEAVVGAAPWHLGSNAKSMTAILVARLVEKGQVSWDDQAGAVLGELIPDIDPGLAQATYVDLLSHRSGLPANATSPVLRALAGTRDDVVADRLTYAGAVLTESPPAAIGAFAYSNAGYVVVGAMLEQATGQSWEQLITREVFAPLGLNSAGFGAPQGPGVPLGHSVGVLGLRAVPPGPNADNITAMGPAGRVHMSLDDYADYLTLTALRPPDFLPAQAWARLQTPPDDVAPYALGWAVGPDGTLSHDGSNTLWYARAIVWPDKGATALVVNLGNVAAAMDRIGAELAPE